MYGKICMTFAKEIIEEKNRRFAKSYMQKALAKGDTRSQIVADLIDICEVSLTRLQNFTKATLSCLLKRTVLT